MSFWKKISEISGPAGSKEMQTNAGQDSLKPGVSAPIGSSSTETSIRAQGKQPQQVAGQTLIDLGDVEEALAARFGKTRSALGSGTVIQGKLSFDTPVRIDGKLSGEVYSSKALIIGPSGRIDAQLEVQTLIVLGQVFGTIKASERVEILGSGEISGDILTPVLVISEGCKFSGSCKMPQAKQERAAGTSGGGSQKADGSKEGASVRQQGEQRVMSSQAGEINLIQTV